jgi:hypothetical protein
MKCSGASYSIAYPQSEDHTSELNINIPALMSADPANWNLTVYLDLTYPPDNVSSSQARVIFSSSRLSIKSTGQLPSDGIVQLKVALAASVTVAKWKFPCVMEIPCNIPQPPITHLVGSIIISSVGLGVIVALLICVKICHLRAKKNDKLRVRNQKKCSD